MCTKAQVLALLEGIRGELRCKADKRILDNYIQLIREHAWEDVKRELFIKP